MRQRVIALLLLLIFAAGGIFYFLSVKPGNKTAAADSTSSIAAPAPLQINIVNNFPHDTSSFTEGLQYIDGYLYESTGLNGQSYLKKIELNTGKTVKSIKLKDDYFGEGLTVLGDKIYQLTYTQKTGFVYNKSDFSLIKTFSYPFEGWGMTTDGHQLIISDGSNIIHLYDPNTLTEVSHISVQDNNGLLSNVNELEWIDGYIYANVWQTHYILKIDPKTGIVVGKADLSTLLKTVLPPDFDADQNVMNGIAYDAAAKKIYITGKNWPKLFEITMN